VYALLLVYTTLLSITTEILTFFARPVNTGMTTYRIHGSDAEVEPAAFPNLWRVTNCFDSPTFGWLSQAFLNQQNQWTRPQDCLEYRLQLTPESQTQRRIYGLWEDLTTAMQEITGIKELLPVTSKVWLDLPYFHCPYHPDSDFLLVTYQVYLWGYGGDIPGTSFCESSDATQFNPGNQIEIPFVPNTGYINLNTDQKVHHVKRSNGMRLSACWQWRTKV
jgi:hypothetical protein